MNTSAERHLVKAAKFIARGEEFYRKAAEEIIAAQEADPSLSLNEVDRVNGWGHSYAAKLVKWHRSGDRDLRSPFGTQAARDKHQAKRLLRDGPLEQVEQIISELPPERQQDVAAAAGHAYMKARQTYRETERNVTPAQREERKAAGEQMTRPVVTWTDSMQLLSSLEGAHLHLLELIEGGQMSVDLVNKVGDWIDKIAAEYQVARAMVGLTIDLDNEEVRS